MFRYLIAVIMLCVGVANTNIAKADDVSPQLLPLKYKVQALMEANTDGFITKDETDKAIDAYVIKAHDIYSGVNTKEDLLSVNGTIDNAAEKKTVGFFTFTHIILVLAGIIAAGSFCYFFYSVFLSIPATVYEAILYMGSIAMVLAGTRVASYGTYYAFTGCLGIAGSMIVSARIHHLKENLPRFFGILTILWAPAAIYFNSELIGFISVISLMGLLGFNAGMSTFTYWIGFQNEKSVPSATAAAFALLITFCLVNGVGDQYPPLAVFKPGAIWMGSFVGYLGLIIMSNRWYLDNVRINYLLMNGATILAGIGAIYFGSTYNIPQLQQIGGTFFCLYLLEKVIEIPAENAKQWSFIGMVVSGIIFWLASNAHEHQDLIHKYFVFQ